MKFKALQSPKQFFVFKGMTFKANLGILMVEDKEVINYLLESPAWSTDEKLPEVKKVEAVTPKVITKPKTKTKKGNK